MIDIQMKKIKLKNKYYSNYSKGAGLMEIIIGTTIISLSLVGLITAFNLFVRTGLSNTQKVQAVYILEESIEAFRYIRDGGWAANISSLTRNVQYNLAFDGLNWEATTTQAFIDDVFDRTITVEDVYRRDSDDDIVASTSPDSKTLDPNTIQVTAKVLWDGNEVDSTTYFTNILNN
jgi:type II secretory pathway pseudopilin PulG